MGHPGRSGLRERELQRDCRILEDELVERPDVPFGLFDLGSVAVGRQDSSGALGHLRRRLSGSAPTISIVRELLALVVRCHQMQGDLAAALAASDEGLPLDRDDAETHFRKPGSAAKSASRPRPKLAGEVS